MTTTTTRTSFGDLRGLVDDGVVVFRGVPYARPPLGALRFAAPGPPEAWRGVRDATAFGPAALQLANAVGGEQHVMPDSGEDCLSLNIWTPAVDGGRRPVIVWLHGGAFLIGAGSSPMNHGAVLARRGDVVVVTINYRLGLFGYLRGLDVCGDALPSTGNEGLLDQLSALNWVRDEIAAFGGDPENVTVAGQSAGAISVSAMLSMAHARRPFQKAILQSGSALLRAPASANRVMEAILADLNLAPHQAGRLRELPAHQLLDVQTRVTPRSAGVSYSPVADGDLLPADPFAAIAAGSAAGVPLLLGSNLEEWSFFRRMDPDLDSLTDDGLLARLADPRTSAHSGDIVQFDPAEVVELYRRERAARGESTAAPEIWLAIMGDRRYRVPVMRLAELQAAHTPRVYAYQFTWRSPAQGGKLGAGHVVEVPFVFGTHDRPASHHLVPPGSDVGTLPTRMQDAWIAFARTGSPQTPELPTWEPYSAARRSTMRLGPTCVPVDAPQEAERAFWASRTAGGTHAAASVV